MAPLELLQILLFFSLLIGLTPPLGNYMRRAFLGRRVWLTPVVQPVEGLVYRLAGVDPLVEMGWQSYLAAVLIFNLAGFALLFGLLLAQGMLPLRGKRRTISENVRSWTLGVTYGSKPAALRSVAVVL